MSRKIHRRKAFRSSGPQPIESPEYIVTVGNGLRRQDSGIHYIASQNIGDPPSPNDWNFYNDTMPIPYVDQDDGRTFHFVTKSPFYVPPASSVVANYICGMGDGRNSVNSPQMRMYWRSQTTDPTGSGYVVRNWAVQIFWEPLNETPSSIFFQDTVNVDWNNNLDKWYHFFLTGDDTNGFECAVIGEDRVYHKLNKYYPNDAITWEGQWFGDMGFASNEPSGLVNGLGQMFLIGGYYKFFVTSNTIKNRIAQITHWHRKLSQAESEELYITDGLIDPSTVSFADKLRNHYATDTGLGDTDTSISDQTSHSPMNKNEFGSDYTFYFKYPQPDSWGQTKSFELEEGVGESIDFGNVLDVDGTEARTYSCWFYWPAVTSVNHFLFYKYTGGVGLRIYVDTIERVNFSLRAAAGAEHLAIRTAAKPITSAWNHLIITYDGSKTAAGAEMMLNGFWDNVATLNDTLVASTSNSSNMQVLGFDGNLFSRQIWNVEFTPQECYELWNEGIQFDPLTHSRSANLIHDISPGNVPGDDSTGTTGIIQDRSASGFDGTPIGTLVTDIVTLAPD